MTPTTIRRLNALNQQFYRTTASAFSASRQQPWAGWEKVWEVIQPKSAEHGAAPAELSIWDVGCGNGRFAQFYAGQLAALPATPLQYLGIDSSPELLAEAEKLADTLPHTQLHLQQLDLVEAMITTGATDQTDPSWDAVYPQFDLIVCFGVLHHMPSFALRVQLLKTLAAHLKPHGQLVATCWQFPNNPNLLQRAVPAATVGFTDDELEPNDFFLTWERGAQAIRYCHWVDSVEQAKMLAAAGLTQIVQFTADGKSGVENWYGVCEKKENPLPKL